MAEIDRLTQSTDWIDLDFVERERTPRAVIEKGIRHHLAGLSLSNTVTLLADFGVERSRTAIHNWVKKADLQPTDGENPDRVAVDQKMIRINDEKYWLYAAVDPHANRFLHIRLFPTYSIPITKEFLAELVEKHDVDDARELETALRETGFEYRIQIHGFRNSIERVFREVEQRTICFSNCFSNAEAETADDWIRSFSFAWNQLI